MNKIVILGGTGFVGRHLCEHLARQVPGCRLVVPTRRRANGLALQVLPQVTLAQADVHDATSLASVLGGADAVVNLVAILHGDAASFERAHVQLPRQLAAACVQARVRRVVHVSALGVAPQAPSLYLRSKAAGEAVWQQAAAQHGLDIALLRPSVIFGSDDRFTNLFAGLQRLFPVLPLGGAEAQFQPVWVGDVAQAITQCLSTQALPGPVIECAGPHVLSLRQLVQQVGEMAGCRRPVIGLPESLAMAQATLLGLLPGEPLMSRDNVRSMQVPNVASGQLPGLSALGIQASPLAMMASHFNPPDPRQR